MSMTQENVLCCIRAGNIHQLGVTFTSDYAPRLQEAANTTVIDCFCSKTPNVLYSAL